MNLTERAQITMTDSAARRFTAPPTSASRRQRLNKHAHDRFFCRKMGRIAASFLSSILDYARESPGRSRRL